MSDSCYYEYEEKLQQLEQAIQLNREQHWQKVVEHSKNALAQVHYIVSLASTHVYALGLDVWEMAGELELEIFGTPHKVGRWALIGVLLLTKARLFLQVTSNTLIR